MKNKFRPVLSDKSIKEFLKERMLVSNPGIVLKGAIQPNSLDLTLSDSLAYLDYKLGEVIDMNHPINYRQAEMDEEDGCKSVLIQPGEFLLMSSNEELNIPNGIIAFVAGRSSIARLGIQVEQAGLIDAGFKGTITFEVYNQTKNPIRLYKGMRIAQVYFIKAEYADSLYGSADRSSKYQSQVLATGSRIHKDVIESKDTNLAIGSNISLSQLRYIDDAYKILSDD